MKQGNIIHCLNKNLSFYYRFYVREYRFYPEGKFATVDIDD